VKDVIYIFKQETKHFGVKSGVSKDIWPNDDGKR
jgi:hypothetical protein